MVGGPPQMDLYDYKPKMDDWYDKDLPESIRNGQRLTTMTSGPGALPHRAVEVQVRPARQVRHVGQRTAAVDGQDGRRHVLHPLDAHRGHQPRAGHHLHADRQPGHRPAVPRRRGRPTASARSTRTCRRSSCWSPSRPTPSRCRRSRPGSGRRATCPANTPASPSAPAATRSCTSTTRPACRRDVRRKTLDGLQGAQRDELPSSSATRRRTRASSSTRWPSACRPACPS